MKKEYKVFNWNYWWQSTTSECANGVAHSRCVVGISLYPLIILYYIYIYFYVYLTYSSNFTFNLNLTISTNTTTANTSEINTIRSSAPLWTQSYTNNAAYYFNYINPSSIYILIFVDWYQVIWKLIPRRLLFWLCFYLLQTLFFDLHFDVTMEMESILDLFHFAWNSLTSKTL